MKKSRRYLGVVDGGGPDSAYGVWFPDVPGATSAADEAEDLVAMCNECLHLWAEDAELPEPSSYLEIIARDDVKEALAEGAYLMSIPFIENDTAVVRANVSLERGLLDAIDDAAKAQGLTRSAFLASAARAKIFESA
jgi:predicted RNase H-like HicB family nuclease